MAWFGHSGDLGDIIYALPTIRAAGGGTLYLYHLHGKTMHGMDASKAENLRSLLILQSYLTDIVFCPDGHPPNASDSSLNKFRYHGRPGRNLADMHLATYGFGPEHRDAPWLEVDRPASPCPVILSRSARYHNDKFPWVRVLETYRAMAGFVGTDAEYAAFCDEIGPVPRVPTADLLEVARVIAGSSLFVGNQSSPAAIAEGLKRPMVLEVYPQLPNCGFERSGRTDGWDQRLSLPML